MKVIHHATITARMCGSASQCNIGVAWLETLSITAAIWAEIQVQSMSSRERSWTNVLNAEGTVALWVKLRPAKTIWGKIAMLILSVSLVVCREKFVKKEVYVCEVKDGGGNFARRYWCKGFRQTHG